MRGAELLWLFVSALAIHLFTLRVVHLVLYDYTWVLYLHGKGVWCVGHIIYLFSSAIDIDELILFGNSIIHCCSCRSIPCGQERVPQTSMCRLASNEGSNVSKGT